MAGTWERRGTVTVTQNSKVVIGAGTYWTDAQNGPQVGNTFYGPDGRAHEVAVIRSATELWLADNYKGATAAGAAYQIDTTRVDSVPGLASRVAAVLAFAQGQYGNLDRWTQGGDNEDVTLTSPNGESVTVPSLAKTAKTCRVAVPEHEAKAGAHPISGVTGLQTALDGKAASNVVTVHEAKAGAHPISGVTGLQAALDGMYQKGNILGSVSQSNGVPTGAIIQRGSNANGDFVRYADGTQICLTTADIPATALNQQATVSKAHPIAFSRVDAVQYSTASQIGSGSQAAIGLLYQNGIYSSGTTVSTLRLDSYAYRHATNEPVRFNVTTHGRWY